MVSIGALAQHHLLPVLSAVGLPLPTILKLATVSALLERLQAQQLKHILSLIPARLGANAHLPIT